MSNMRGTALPEDQTNITFSFFTTPYFFSTSIPQIPKDLEKNVVVLFCSCNTFHRLGGLYNTNLLSYGSGEQKSETGLR